MQTSKRARKRKLDTAKAELELKSGLNSHRLGGPRPIDEKKLDFRTAFLEVGTGDERNWINLRVGGMSWNMVPVA